MLWVVCLIGNFACFLSSGDFSFKINFSKNSFRNECQTVWIQIRPDAMSGLIWVQIVCEGYQQTTVVGKEFNAHIVLYTMNVLNVVADVNPGHPLFRHK